MPDSHSIAEAFSSFTPLPSLQPADVSHPDHTTLLQTAHLLASQSIWPSSISGSALQAECRSVYNLGTQSRTNSNNYLLHTCSWEKRGVIAAKPADDKRYQSDKNHTCLINVSHCTLDVSLLCSGAGFNVSTCCWLVREFSKDSLTPPFLLLCTIHKGKSCFFFA